MQEDKQGHPFLRPHSIETKEEYEAALASVASLFSAEPGTPEGDTLELLIRLIATYEAREYPIPLPDPEAAILFRMDQSGQTNDNLTSE